MCVLSKKGSCNLRGTLWGGTHQNVAKSRRLYTLLSDKVVVNVYTTDSVGENSSELPANCSLATAATTPSTMWQ